VIRTDLPIYLDANVLIYAKETDGNSGMLARRWLLQADRGRMRAVTSGLTVVEVLPYPIAANDDVILSGYRRLLGGFPNFSVVPVTTAILYRAAELRAELGGDTPDAIHVATALAAGCGGLVTNDDRIKLPPDLARHALDDVLTLYR